MTKNKYKKDFPETGYFNWKTVKLKVPEDIYCDDATAIGVVLHDGKVMINGVIFGENQFTIIDDDPLNIQEKSK